MPKGLIDDHFGELNRMKGLSCGLSDCPILAPHAFELCVDAFGQVEPLANSCPPVVASAKGALHDGDHSNVTVWGEFSDGREYVVLKHHEQWTPTVSVGFVFDAREFGHVPSAARNV